MRYDTIRPDGGLAVKTSLPDGYSGLSDLYENMSENYIEKTYEIQLNINI